MAQNYTINSYHASHIGIVDLVNMENNFACMQSLFSGTASPSNPVSGMLWFDMTNELLRLRNADNNQWIGVMYGDADTKIWIYSNTAADGWAIDATPVDCVLAVKGGSEDYDAAGETVQGSWTQPGCILTTAQLPAHTHGEDGAHTHSIRRVSGSGYATCYVASDVNIQSKIAIAAGGDHTHTSGDLSGDSHNHGTTYRPYAAIGTMQHPDL